jgi:hypothetical protein
VDDRSAAKAIDLTYILLKPEPSYEVRYADYLRRCIESKDERHLGPSFNVMFEDYCAARAKVEIAPLKA